MHFLCSLFGERGRGGEEGVFLVINAKQKMHTAGDMGPGVLDQLLLVNSNDARRGTFRTENMSTRNCTHCGPALLPLLQQEDACGFTLGIRELTHPLPLPLIALPQSQTGKL